MQDKGHIQRPPSWVQGAFILQPLGEPRSRPQSTSRMRAAWKLDRVQMGPGPGTFHTTECRNGVEQQLLEAHLASPAISLSPPEHSLEASSSQSPGKPGLHSGWRCRGGGEEMVCRERFVLLQLFKSVSQGGVGEGCSSIKWKHVWSWRSFWKKSKNTNSFYSAGLGQSTEGPWPWSRMLPLPPSLIFSVYLSLLWVFLSPSISPSTQ